MSDPTTGSVSVQVTGTAAGAANTATLLARSPAPLGDASLRARSLVTKSG